MKQTWTSLLAGQCGIRSLNPEQFASQQSRIAGFVPQGNAAESAWTASEWLSRDQIRRMPTFMQYALVAAREALSDAKWSAENDQDRTDTGVCIGSGIGAFEDIFSTSLLYSQQGPKKVSPLFVPRLLINSAAAHISMEFGFQGPSHAATTACATGAHSIGDAAKFIQLGEAKVMVAGGAESCIHPLAITGFERSRSLTTVSNDAPHTASRPFDKDRAGFVMAEGAAVLVLEERQHALSRGAKIYAELAGYGFASDAHHLTQPPADGNGAYRSMRRALQGAGLLPKSIDYINAHATSTPLGDVAEARAVKDLMLGEDGFTKEDNVCISSTKGATGHLLGAAGAIEAVFSVLAIEHNVVPPTINLEKVDESMPNFNFVPLQKQEKRIDTVLTNSFGFGGINASLCFTKSKD